MHNSGRLRTVYRTGPGYSAVPLRFSRCLAIGQGAKPGPIPKRGENLLVRMLDAGGESGTESCVPSRMSALPPLLPESVH